MENKRVVWLDALKGFAIFLVVLGHCIERVKTGNSTNPILEQTDIFIYGFHMMLFFMISGYIYGLKENKRNTPEPFWHFTKVKLIDYGIPYLIFAVLVWGGKFIFSAFVKFQVSIKDLLLVFVNPVAFTWFLYILLWVSVIVKALDLLVKDRKKVWFITLIMVVVGMIFKTDIKLVDRVLLYTIAYYTGTLISSDFENKVCKNKLLLAVLAVLFIGFSIGRGFVGKQDTTLMAVTGVTGSVLFMVAFSKIGELKNIVYKTLIFFGEITIFIYILHPVFLSAMKVALAKVGITNIPLHLVLLLIVGFVCPIIYYLVSKKIWILDAVFRPRRYMKKDI